MIYLLDTSALSVPTKRNPDPELLRRFQRIELSSVISSTTLCEFRFGLLRLSPGRRREDLAEYLDKYLSEHAIYHYDRAAAEWHAAERARLTGLGQTPPFADGQIAAVAATNDLTLVTRNPRDYEHFEGLRLEAWG